MNIHSKVLALCICNVWSAGAFFVPASKTDRVALRSYERTWDEDVRVGERVRMNGPETERNYPVLSDRNRGSSNLIRGPEDRSYGGIEYGRQYDRPRSSLVQGNSRSTYNNPYNDPVEVSLETDGRPLDGEFEVWDGPGNTPTRMKVYSEDGRKHPFRAMVQNPRRGSSTMSFRNSGPLEFPMAADVESPMPGRWNTYSSPGKTVQGGALKTWSLDHSVGSVQITIESNGLPVMATVELWGISGHNKQIAEIYNDNGLSRPFTAIIETPGSHNTIAIRNKGPMSYPLTASVDTHTVAINGDYMNGGPLMSGPW